MFLYYIKMPNKQKGGNAQMYNTNGLISSTGYTHTVAGSGIATPLFAGLREGMIGGGGSIKYNGGSYKLHRGERNGLFIYYMKDGIRTKKYFKQPIQIPDKKN